MSLTIGAMTWRQVVSGGGRPTSRAPIRPEDIIAQPGDVYEVSIPAAATLLGDNLQAGFLVGSAGSDVPQPGVDVGFYVQDVNGQKIAPHAETAGLGDVVPVPGLTGNDGGRSTEWTVVVRMTMGGTVQWSGGTGSPDLPTWAMGALTVDLRQVLDDPSDGGSQP
jgi:hypothetical protein